jgi:molybdate transport system ATP-binding protein
MAGAARRRARARKLTMLEVDVKKRLGRFDLAVDFVSTGGVTALFGASGAGKTTLVSILAGLIRPDSGHVVLDGEALYSSAANIHVPPDRRRIGYVFQEGRLFPHFSVRGNLDYGRRMSRRKQNAGEFDSVVAMLDLEALLDRRPGSLSGGERQRVAIGRALLMQPRLLLLDEPLASLDAARKREIFPYLERLRDAAKVPMVYVSHQPNEIRRIANSVVLLEAGRIAALGGLELVNGGTDKLV